MNEKDRREIENRLDDPDFRAIFAELVSMRLAYPDVATTKATPTAEEVRQGKPGRILIAGRNGFPTRAAIPIAQVLIQRVHFHASRLAAFFPEARRYHWQQVFLTIGLNGTGEVRQAQRGGLSNPELAAIYDEWKASGYDVRVKRQRKAAYLAKYPEEAEAGERFDRYMRRRKRGDKSP